MIQKDMDAGGLNENILFDKKRVEKDHPRDQSRITFI